MLSAREGDPELADTGVTGQTLLPAAVQGEVTVKLELEMSKNTAQVLSAHSTMTLAKLVLATPAGRVTLWEPSLGVEEASVYG